MLSKPKLLFLSHRIPFPPDKGDKIRSYNMLKGLARSYRIFLGTFVDESSDWVYVDKLEALCEEVCAVKLTTSRKLQRATMGFVKGLPLTVACYIDKDLDLWVRKVIEQHGIERSIAFSSGVAQFVERLNAPNMRTMIDFVDVDSTKWSQYARTCNWPFRWVCERESKLLLEIESKLAAHFDVSIFVSRNEADFFCTLVPESAGNITYVNNGVDSEYFKPGLHVANPYAKGFKPIVFTGAMDYWPNIDAVVRFNEEVMPALLAIDSQWRFYVVGSNPHKRVIALQGINGTHVTGRVEDVRPWLNYAKVSVAPMKIARGVQNKILEGMSMATPVIATPQALEGIQASNGIEVVVATEPDEIVKTILDIGTGKHSVSGDAGRAFVVRQFSWSNNVERMVRLLEGKVL